MLRLLNLVGIFFKKKKFFFYGARYLKPNNLNLFDQGC